ncbi:hypothetical protein D3227_36655 [Mesorhizobium waimense]|uniref:Abortive infection protein-like C-terminal domain-containing protein n=2 Tax=Mesorhizobium waimense TaxID=1300307 RepID=A0A3A5JUS7_9HYPH|nr:hypothetical protein D3227_36655 [Mesorhizobium waimense]
MTAVQSIGSLRTHVGGAQGKEKGFRRIDARVAKLAIHSASAIALFIIETWQISHPGRKLPLRYKPKESWADSRRAAWSPGSSTADIQIRRASPCSDPRQT